MPPPANRGLTDPREKDQRKRLARPGCNTFVEIVSNRERGHENPMRVLCFLPLAGIFTLAAMPAAGVAQSASFEIAENGHAVGTASYEFTATPHGYESASLVKVAMQGLDYALSKNEQLSQANELEHAQLNATVNGEAVNVIAAPDSAQLLLNISANGKSTTTRLAAHAGAVLMPDFDPGALETLLTLAVMKDNRDVWAILPKQAGSIEPVRLATYPDQEGTLGDKPITVHHLVATIAGANTDLFSGPENQLLQAELPQAGFALIRKGFVLKPAARPIVPPTATAPAS
jgi:hypothetical protein